jgi:hypothetical protein
MGLSRGTRPIIFGFIFAIGITLTLPHLAFGAAHSFGGSRSFRAPGIHGQPFFSRTFHPFGFFGVGGVSEQPVIIIQQFQPAAATEPREPATNRIYVQPRWVDGGYGVEVLQPGYWTYPK